MIFAGRNLFSYLRDSACSKFIRSASLHHIDHCKRLSVKYNTLLLDDLRIRFLASTSYLVLR